MIKYNDILNKQLSEDYDKLLELCMYALLPKRIYNHELDECNKRKFKKIIQENLDKDTWTIRKEIEKCWDGNEWNR